MTYLLPNAARISLFHDLAAHSMTSQAVAGFVLDPDDAVATAAAETLAEAANKAPVESAALERLILIRPWLQPGRQRAADDTIKAMRRNALPGQLPEPAKTVKCLASLCDGSGAMQLFAAQKVGTR